MSLRQDTIHGQLETLDYMRKGYNLYQCPTWFELVNRYGDTFTADGRSVQALKRKGLVIRIGTNRYGDKIYGLKDE